MTPCPEYETLLIDRAAGELSEADRLAVERHLAECRACQAESIAVTQLLRAAALPPRSSEERAALASLAHHTARAWRGRERASSLLQGAAAGLVAGAVAATLLFILPAGRPAGAVNRPRSDPTVIALERWASPLPMTSELREIAIEGSDADLGDEGELWQ